MTGSSVDGTLVKLLNAFVGARCALCAAPCDGELCRGCAASLPWIAKPCTGCALPLPDDATDLCADCLKTQPHFAWAWAAFRLAPPVQGLIHELKYSANLGVASMLGRLAAARLSKRPRPMPDALIPVPLYAARLRMRGYNQALELARALASVFSIAVLHDATERIRATADQIGQSASQRRQNLRGAFRARRSLAGVRVALLDDVMTTGSTLSELARACDEAGATSVEAWAIARAL